MLYPIMNLLFTFTNKDTNNSFDNIIIDSNGPELNENVSIQQYTGGGIFLVFSNLKTAVPCVYLDYDDGDFLATVVNRYVNVNWQIDWDHFNQTGLINTITDVMKQYNSARAIGLNYWYGFYQTPPSGFDTTYKWVQIGINFENNTLIKLVGDNNPYLSLGEYHNNHYLLVWCKTGIKA